MRLGQVLIGATLAVACGVAAVSRVDAKEPQDAEPAPTYRLRIQAVADEDGAPLAGTQILAWREADDTGQAFEARAVTGADGALAIPDLPYGDFEIVARAAGRVRAAAGIQITGSCVVYGRLLGVQNGQSDVLELRLRKGRTIAGRIVDAVTRRPVPGLKVSALPQTYEVPRLSRQHYGTAVTAPDGTFVVGGVPPETDLHVLAQGAGWTVASTETRADSAAGLELAVSSAGSVGGVVRGTDGGLAQGVHVFAILERDAEYQSSPGVLAGPAGNQPGASSLRATTDAQGRWSLPHLAARAEYRVWAVLGDQSASRTVTGVKVGAGESVTHDLALEPLVERTLSVEYPDGTKVRLEGEIEPVGGAYPASVSGPDDDERLHRLINAHVGRYRLVYENYDVLDQAVEFEVPEKDQGPIRVLIERGLSVGGVVTDAAGRPMAGVHVTCEPVDALENDDGWVRHGGRTKTQRDGSFLMFGLAEVPYTIEFWDRGPTPFESRRIEPPFPNLEVDRAAPPAPSTLRFRVPPRWLARGPRLHFSIRDARAHGDVTWSTYEDVVCDADGVGVVEFDCEGELFLDLDVLGWPPLLVPFAAKRGETTDLGTLEEPPSVPVDLRVVDARGKPIEGVEVLPHLREDLGGKTDANGHLDLRAVAVGRVPLWMSAEGYPRQVPEIVASADAGRIDVLLLRGGTLRGRVEDEDGRPVSMDLFAYVVDELGQGTHQNRVRSDAAGQFSLTALPGSWRVEVRRGEEVVGMATVQVHDELIADVVVVVPSAE